METYRSGYNGTDSKSVVRQRTVGSNPTVSAINGHPCDVRFIVEWCGENPPGAPANDRLSLTDKGCVVSLRTEQYPTASAINGHLNGVRFIVEWCGENPPGAPVFDGLPLTDKGCVVRLRTEQYPTYFP